jgi:hypothetical protein
MAQVNCPKCGVQISDSATECPHCGYPTGPFWLRIWPRLRQLAFPGLLLLLLFGGGGFLRHKMRAQVTRRHAEAIAALRLSISAGEACRQMVQIRLAPAAKPKFNPGGVDPIEIPTRESVVVAGLVEAKNGAGAMVRSKYSCGMRRDTMKGVWVGSSAISAAPQSDRRPNR